MAAGDFRSRLRHLTASLLMIGALFGSAWASALSIGEIELQSRVGEPLRATVPLGNLGTLSRDEILVGRASEEVHRAYGIDKAAYANPLRFELVVDAKGNASVNVSTEQPVAEPMVDMVLEVRWPSGRAVREFTLLLDLP